MAFSRMLCFERHFASAQKHVASLRITDVGVIYSEWGKTTIKGPSHVCMAAERRAFHNRLQGRRTNPRAGRGSEGFDWLLVGPVVMMMMGMRTQTWCFAETRLPAESPSPMRERALSGFISDLQHRP